MKTDVVDKLKNDFRLNVPVYIYASIHHGQTHEKYEASGKASLRGILCNVERANDQGKHRNPIYRPASTFEAEKRGLEVWWWF
jgi:hypothetical protein